MILLLTSFTSSPEQDAVVNALIGKAPQDIQVAYIANAYDVYHDENTVLEGADEIRRKGYDVEHVDLREWRSDRAGLRAKLSSKDMFVLTGGNPYYLRWLMKATGADQIITDLVKLGKVYSGASAAAVVAGPTLRCFDKLDDPNEAEEIIWDGLGLTDIVVVPHTDNADFGAGCREAGAKLKAQGYATLEILDNQALLVTGGERRVL